MFQKIALVVMAVVALLGSAFVVSGKSSQDIDQAVSVFLWNVLLLNARAEIAEAQLVHASSLALKPLPSTDVGTASYGSLPPLTDSGKPAELAELNQKPSLSSVPKLIRKTDVR